MIKRTVAIGLLLLSCLNTPITATAEESTLLPKLPPAKGEQCVEPTEVMRREHMNFILHQRDLTVHDGIRTKKHNFVNCINCHVQPDEQGVYPRHTSSEHFCTACHQFTSVSIDCFQCHADRPAERVSVDTKTQRHADFLRQMEQLDDQADE